MRFLGKFSVSVFLFVTFSTLAIAALPGVHILFNSQKTAVTGKAIQFDKGSNYRTVQIVLGGASAASGVATLQGSLDGDNWVTLNTFNVASSPAASATQVASITTPYPALRGVISEIYSASGAAAASAAAITMMVAE